MKLNFKIIFVQQMNIYKTKALTYMIFKIMSFTWNVLCGMYHSAEKPTSCYLGQ